jgi:ubiquinone/menaquinone biosynthesis C-methylase UbiE
MKGYNDIVKRIQSGQKFLDLGCCLGQEIRKLVHDGAPSENIMGSELHGEFVELGYDLFRDHDKLKSKFVVGDFFKLTGRGFHGERFDIIYQSAFLHLFNLQDQTDLIIKVVTELLKGPGSMFVGRQIGAINATEYQSKALRTVACYWHNEETWQRMVNTVASKIGKKFESKFELGERLPRSEYDFGREDVVNFGFCITLL